MCVLFTATKFIKVILLLFTTKNISLMITVILSFECNYKPCVCEIVMINKLNICLNDA